MPIIKWGSPWRAFRNEIEAEREWKQKEAGGQGQPVPLEAPAHDVAAEDP